jgi:hypothetical protein
MLPNKRVPNPFTRSRGKRMARITKVCVASFVHPHECTQCSAPSLAASAVLRMRSMSKTSVIVDCAGMLPKQQQACWQMEEVH